jgi:hypothetical protein
MKYFILLCGFIFLIASCQNENSSKSTAHEKGVNNMSDYKGTASITKGSSNTQAEKVFECAGGRPTNEGFNSSIARFTVNRPFSIAMKLVDWEEALGLGTEKNRSSNFHAGDGGMVAVIKDVNDSIIAKTNENWKAQTFYTSPVKDLSCVREIGMRRTTDDCDQSYSDKGKSFYGLHWELPKDWEKANFDDSKWPNATTYTNETIGVDYKKAYTNFSDIFDHQTLDAQFIWSSNVVLDNEVVVRYSVSNL